MNQADEFCIAAKASNGSEEAKVVAYKFQHLITHQLLHKNKGVKLFKDGSVATLKQIKTNCVLCAIPKDKVPQELLEMIKYASDLYEAANQLKET